MPEQGSVKTKPCRLKMATKLGIANAHVRVTSTVACVAHVRVSASGTSHTGYCAAPF